jgi:hypothetical protein
MKINKIKIEKLTMALMLYPLCYYLLWISTGKLDINVSHNSFLDGAVRVVIFMFFSVSWGGWIVPRIFNWIYDDSKKQVDI